MATHRLSLEQEYLRVLTLSGYKNVFYLLVWLQLFLAALPPYLSDYVLKTGNSGLASWMLITECLSMGMKIVWSVFVTKLNKKIDRIIYSEAYNRYAGLSHTSKETKEARELRTKLKNTSNTIANVGYWGIVQIMEILSGMVSMTIIFITNNAYFMMGVIVFSYTMLYVFYVREKQKTVNAKRMEFNEMNDKTNNLASLQTAKLTWGDMKNVSTLLELEDSEIKNTYEMEMHWIWMYIPIDILGVLIRFGVLFMDNSNIGIMMNTYNIISQFSNKIGHLTAFSTRWTGMEQDWRTYNSFWLNLEAAKEAEQQELGAEIQIIKTEIHQDGNLTVGPELTIKSGDTVLLQGPSGFGKSTWLKALTGRISGTIFKTGIPENFRACFVEFTQNIKEYLPTSSISIRELFDNVDSEIIWQAIQFVGISNWLEVLKPKVTSSLEEHKSNILGLVGLLFGYVNDKSNSVDYDSKKDDVVIEMVIEMDRLNVDPLDVVIRGRISGGQKTRLAFAYVLVKLFQAMKTKGKEWVLKNHVLIIDELEQGLDRDVFYELMGKILAEFKGMTIIVISHGEIIKERYSWTHCIEAVSLGKLEKVI